MIYWLSRYILIKEKNIFGISYFYSYWCFIQWRKNIYEETTNCDHYVQINHNF